MDAKHRSSRPALHEGLSDAHVYQDALRWHRKRAVATYIVAPACSADASLYTTEAYLSEHRFGVLVTASKDCYRSVFRQLLGDGDA